MLIVSDFHDYYDVILKYGVDKSVVYKRKEVEIDGVDDQTPIIGVIGDSWWSRGKTIKPSLPFKYDFGVVGFCGKIHPIVIIHEEVEKKGLTSFLAPEIKSTYFYRADELDSFIINHKDKKKKKSYLTPKRYWYSKGDTNQGLTHQFFNHFKDIKNDVLFCEMDTPIFSYIGGDVQKRKLRKNPSLKDLEFFKVEDPFSAYQKIYQYISGVLGISTNELLEISDEDMKAEKGFFEWSFKTPPGTKKPRRRGK